MCRWSCDCRTVTCLKTRLNKITGCDDSIPQGFARNVVLNLHMPTVCIRVDCIKMSIEFHVYLIPYERRTGNFRVLTVLLVKNQVLLDTMGTAVAQWLRCCATNRKVAGSIPPGASGFFIDIKSFRSHYGPGVDSACNRNEYQEHFLGVKAAGA